MRRILMLASGRGYCSTTTGCEQHESGGVGDDDTVGVYDDVVLRRQLGLGVVEAMQVVGSSRVAVLDRTRGVLLA